MKQKTQEGKKLTIFKSPIADRQSITRGSFLAKNRHGILHVFLQVQSLSIYLCVVGVKVAG